MLLSLNKSIATFPTLSEDSMTSTSYDGSYDPIPSMISIADDDPVPAYLQPAHRAPLSSLTGQTRFPLPNLNSSSNSSSSQSLHISKSENGSAYNSFYNDSYNLADTNSAPQMVRKTAHILHLAPEMKSSLGFARVSLRAPKKRRVNESKTEIRFLKESQHLQDREGEIKSRKGDSSAQFGVELQTPSDVLRREVGTTLDPSKSNGNILTPWTESTHSTSENPGTYHYDIPPTEVGNEASIQKGKVGNPKSLPNQTESHDSKTKIIRDSYQSSKSSQSSATTARLAHSRLPASQFNSPTHTYAAAQDTSRPNKPKSKSSIPRYRSSLNSSSQSSNFATSAILPPQPTQKAKPYDVKAVREFMKRKKLEQKLKPPVNADNLNDILKPLHVVPEPNDKSKKKPYDPNKVQEYIKSKENSRLAEIQRLEEAKAEEERKRRERLKKLDEFRRQQRIKKERKMEKERQIRREMEEIERKRLGAIGAAEYEGRQEGTKEDDALKAASGDIGTTDASADQGLPYTAAVNSLLIPAINVNGSSSNSIDDISESRHTSSSNSPSASSSDFAPAVESKLPSVEKGEDRSQPSAKEESSIRSNSPVIDVGSLKLPEVPESIPNPPDSVPSSLPHQRKPVNSVPAGYMDEAVTVNKKHSSTPPPAFNTLPTNSGEDEQVQRIQALVQTAESLQRRLKQTIELDISTLLDESEISQSSEVSAARGEVDGDLVEGVEYTSNLDGPKEDSEMDVRELGLECAGKSSQQDKIKGHSPKSTRVNSEYLAYPSFPPVSSPSEIPRLPTPSAPPLLAVSGRELNSENNSIASDLPSSSQIGRSSARAFTSISTSLINERRTPQKGGQLTPDLSRRIQHTNDHIYFHLPPADKDSMDQDPFTLFRILKRRYVSSKKRSTEVAEPKKVDESSRKERLNESKNYSSDFELVDENVDATTSEPRFVTSQELPSKTLPPTALLPEKSITEETPSPQRFIVHQDTPKLPSERSIPRQQIRSTPQQSPVNVENSLKNDFPRRFPSQSHDAKFQPETQNHHQQLRPPQPHYSPKTLSKSLWAEISLLEAISESRLQLAQIERVRDAGIFEGEREQLSSLLISNQKKHEVELDEARKQRDKIQELLKRRENEGKEKRGKAGIDNSYSETFESFESSLDSSTHERTITSSSPPTRSGSRNSARPKSQLSESVMSLSRKKKQTIRDVEKEDTKESIEKEINAEDAEARTEESFATEMIDHNNGKSSQLQVMEEAIQEEVNSNYSRSMEDSSSAAKKKDKDKEKISMVLSDRTRDLSEPFATSQNGSTRQEMEWLSAQLRSVRPQNDAIPVDVFARLCKDLERAVLTKLSVDAAEMERLRDLHRLEVERKETISKQIKETKKIALTLLKSQQKQSKIENRLKKEEKEVKNLVDTMLSRLKVNTNDTNTAPKSSRSLSNRKDHGKEKVRRENHSFGIGEERVNSSESNRSISRSKPSALREVSSNTSSSKKMKPKLPPVSSSLDTSMHESIFSEMNDSHTPTESIVEDIGDSNQSIAQSVSEDIAKSFSRESIQEEIEESVDNPTSVARQKRSALSYSYTDLTDGETKDSDSLATFSEPPSYAPSPLTVLSDVEEDHELADRIQKLKLEIKLKREAAKNLHMERKKKQEKLREKLKKKEEKLKRELESVNAIIEKSKKSLQETRHPDLSKPRLTEDQHEKLSKRNESESIFSSNPLPNDLSIGGRYVATANFSALPKVDVTKTTNTQQDVGIEKNTQPKADRDIDSFNEPIPNNVDAIVQTPERKKSEEEIYFEKFLSDEFEDMLVSGIDTKMVGSGSSVSTSANNQDVRAAEQLTKAQSYKELFDSFDSSSLNPNFDDFMPEKFPHFMNKESGNGTEPPVDPLKRTKFQSADEVGKVEEDIPEEIIEQNSDRSMGKDDQKSVARVTSNALNTNAPVTSSNDTDNYEDDFASYTEDSSYSSRNQATDHKPSQESSTVSETRDDLSEIVEDIPENEDVVVSKVKVSPSASLLAQSLETSNGRSSTSSSLKNSMTLTAIPENAVFQSNALPSSDQPMSRERSVPSSLETSNTSNSSKDSERTRNIDLSKRFVIDEAELLDVDSYPTFRITDVQSILVPELEPETSKPYTTVDHQVEPDNKDQIKTTDHDGEFGLKLNHELKSTAMNTSLLEVVVHSHDEIIQYVQSPLEASQISVQTLASSLDEDELLEKQADTIANELMEDLYSSTTNSVLSLAQTKAFNYPLEFSDIPYTQSMVRKIVQTLPMNVIYTSPPAISPSVLYDLNVPRTEHNCYILDLINEAITSLFPNYSQSCPSSHPFNLSVPSIPSNSTHKFTHEELVTKTANIITGWIEYGLAKDEYLDEVLIEEILLEEKSWGKNALEDWRTYVKNALAEAIWDDLLDDTIGMLNRVEESKLSKARMTGVSTII